MRFVIRQKILSIGDNFSIKDEVGVEHFIVRGKIFTFGDKLSIYDMAMQEIVYIEQKLFKFLPEYTIYCHGRPAARIKKEFTFINPRFSIESDRGNYSVNGNFFGMDFDIVKNGRLVAQVSKKWFSWADTYGVDISDDEDYAFILAIAIIIDQVIHDNNHNNG